MVYIFNTLALDKVYGDTDYKRLVPIQRYGLDDSFYGGRVKHIGETDTDVLLLMEYKDGTYKAIDTAVEKLDEIPIRFIRELAKKRKLQFNATTKKEELIEMLRN